MKAGSITSVQMLNEVKPDSKNMHEKQQLW